jgi:hypothetical protein
MNFSTTADALLFNFLPKKDFADCINSFSILKVIDWRGIAGILFLEFGLRPICFFCQI